MRKKRNKGCLPIILSAIVLIALVATFRYVRKAYNDTLTRIDKQIAELPEFNKEAAEKKIAEQLNIPYPLSPPKKTRGQWDALAKIKAKKLTETQYPVKNLALQVNSILKTMKCVRRGEHVRFYLNTTRKFVDGTFQRIIVERNEKFVVVNLNKYFFNDISPEYYYLFNKELGQRMAAAKIKNTKNEFKQKKKAFYKTNLERIKRELYEKSGYMRKGGVWTSNYEMLTQRVADEKLNFKRAMTKKRASIIDKNQLFGLISLTPRNDQKTKIEKDEDEKKKTGEKL